MPAQRIAGRGDRVASRSTCTAAAYQH